MTGGPTIREAAVRDADAIQRVAREAWHATYDELLGPETVAVLVDDWFAPGRVVADDVQPPERPLFVALADDEVVGFVEATPGEDDGSFHLYRIYVRPDRWGEGIGTRLLDRIETAVGDRGGERLQLSVFAANEVGVGFYESRGFERVGSERDERFGRERYAYVKHL